ncbi:MAG: hypothetical protein AAGD12_07795, partial [Pseudomonadota bacterium]
MQDQAHWPSGNGSKPLDAQQRMRGDRLGDGLAQTGGIVDFRQVDNEALERVMPVLMRVPVPVVVRVVVCVPVVVRVPMFVVMPVFMIMP